MINLLFYVPLFYYNVSDWEEKKDKLLFHINKNKFEYCGAGEFQTDKNSSKNSYSNDFKDIFEEELCEFIKERNLNGLNMKSVWTVKYNKQNENQSPHNHGSTGYSGVLYLEFDPEVHESTKFIGPWNNPIYDTAETISIPEPREGVIYIWPSSLLHYVKGMKTDKLRMVTSFDMEVK